MIEPTRPNLPTNTDSQGYPVCPWCGFNRSEVTHTYPWIDGVRVRRRVCKFCEKSFTTTQTAESVDL